MLACQAARFVYQDMHAIDSTLPRMLPADADGPAGPPSNAPAPILTMNWDGSGLPADQLQVWNATINWATPSISVVKEGDLAAAAYDSNLCGYARACVPQPGTTARVDTLANRLLHRVQYRNFGSYQTLVASHNVDVNGADRAGVRWYELRKTSGNWAIQQQGTYSPDAVHRFMPSAAMDGHGDIAIGYSVSDATSTFPGVRYAGRLVTDPPGTMQAEVTLINGAGSRRTRRAVGATTR